MSHENIIGNDNFKLRGLKAINDARFLMEDAREDFAKRKWARAVIRAQRATEGFLSGVACIVGTPIKTDGLKYEMNLENCLEIRNFMRSELEHGRLPRMQFNRWANKREAIETMKRMESAWEIVRKHVSLQGDPRFEWIKPSSFRYRAVGKCIYCGSATYGQGRDSTRRLSDEHIIPEGLGGHLVLPEASCKTCADETSRFEHWCLRRTFGPVRIYCKLPSKRLKDRPTTLPVTLFKTPSGEPIPTEVPAELYPLCMPQLFWPRPTLISKMEPAGSDKIHITFLRSKEDFDARLELIAYLYGARKAGLSGVDIGTNRLLRMVAKIAHGYLVAELGADAFKPLLTNIILGQDLTSISRYVGNDSQQKPAPMAVGHGLNREIMAIEGVHYHIVRVHLFPQFGLADYIAIAGEAFV